MNSIYKKIGRGIVFPEFKGGLLYMHKTKMNNICLPKSHSRYTEAIENILSNLKDRDNVCYITVDEKSVCNETHRRAGIHVDFNWFESLGGGKHGHKRMIGSHNGGGSHVPSPKPTHSGGGTHSSFEEFNKNGGMLLVSNHPGCKVYKGEFQGEIDNRGDCSGVDISGLQSEVMVPNDVYFINALGIHEPLVITEKVNRSLIRINLHPEYILK